MRSIRAITLGSIAAGALLAVSAAGAPAKADWHHDHWRAWGGPVVSVGPAYYPPYYAPPPVYVAPPPVYYAPPPPVYYPPAVSVAVPPIALGIHIR